ncbi:hypothetical protein EAF04_006330 [Stromatinia cepivora]|nr:hypothetical protein EAF04_006330 [Stromatinia cepivora]
MLNPRHNFSDAGSRLVELLDREEITDLTTEDPAQLGAPSAPKRNTLSTDWKQHKETIRQLYLDENKTLREVMAIMARSHKHFGSIKQYKNKLRGWKFDTKYKRHQNSRERRHKRQSAVADWSLAARANGHHRQAPNIERAANQQFQIADAMRTDDLLSQAADAGNADAHLFEPTYARRSVECFFQVPDAEDVDDQHSQTTDAGRTNTLSSMCQAPAENKGNSQLSFNRRYSLALPQAAGVRSGRSATPPISIAERILSFAQQHVETSSPTVFRRSIAVMSARA